MEYGELISKCLRQDREAQTQFYHRYKMLINNVALRYMIYVPDAKDVMQMSFVRIFKSMSSLYQDETHLKNWMKRVTINVALNEIRRKKRYDKHRETLSAISPCEVESNDDTDLHLALLSAIDHLSTDHQIIINMIAIDQLSHKEAAKLLSIKEHTSRARYSRAIAALKQKVSEQHVSTLGYE